MLSFLSNINDVISIFNYKFIIIFDNRHDRKDNIEQIKIKND